MITTITLTITHKNPIPDLLDKVAGRAYTLDGVDDVTAAIQDVKAIRNEALEEAAQLAFSWNTAIMDVLANEIRNLKAQQ